MEVWNFLSLSFQLDILRLSIVNEQDIELKTRKEIFKQPRRFLEGHATVSENVSEIFEDFRSLPRRSKNQCIDMIFSVGKSYVARFTVVHVLNV